MLRFYRMRLQTNIYIFNKQTIVCCFVLFFYGNRWEIIFWRSQRCLQINSLQNDVHFNHLGQKLWEKIHFLQPKVNFS